MATTRTNVGDYPTSLLAFVAEARMIANIWLRPGDANSAHNVLQFIESTLHHLGSKTVGLLRADSGFYDQAVFKLLEGKGIHYVISARLTQGLQQARMTLWCDGDSPELAARGNMAQLLGTGRL